MKRNPCFFMFLFVLWNYGNIDWKKVQIKLLHCNFKWPNSSVQKTKRAYLQGFVNQNKLTLFKVSEKNQLTWNVRFILLLVYCVCPLKKGPQFSPQKTRQIAETPSSTRCGKIWSKSWWALAEAFRATNKKTTLWVGEASRDPENFLWNKSPHFPGERIEPSSTNPLLNNGSRFIFIAQKRIR